jgi:TolB-like protein
VIAGSLAVDADHVRVFGVVLETTKHFVVWENYDNRLGHLGI